MGEKKKNIVPDKSEINEIIERLDEHRTSITYCKAGIERFRVCIGELQDSAIDDKKKIKMLVKCVKNLANLAIANILIQIALIVLFVIKLYF